jgi:RNA polymerase sigma-70 factor (ECF subfamily)
MTASDTVQEDAHDMARLVAGNDAALNALMDRHAPRLFNYLLRQLNNETEAADIAQETFVRVYHHRARFRPDHNFTTWLYTIATNLLRNQFRWRKRHPQVSLDAELDDTTASLKDVIPDPAPSPSDRTQSDERAAQVRQAIALLPEDLRTALVLAEYDDLPHAEIATILNCSTKAVEMRLYRARGLLRQRLTRLLEET